jgi:hypothetical protein
VNHWGETISATFFIGVCEAVADSEIAWYSDCV